MKQMLSCAFIFLYVSLPAKAQRLQRIDKEVQRLIDTSERAQERNDSVNAMLYGQQALEKAIALKESQTLAPAFFNSGELNRKYGDYKTAEKQYCSALHIYQQAFDSVKMAQVIRHIGILYGDRGDYPQAMSRYIEALKIYEIKKLKNTELAWLYGNIGNMYNSQRITSRSLEYYFKSLDLFKELCNAEGEASALDHIAIAYGIEGDKVKQMEYYLQSLALYEKENKQERIAVLSTNIGTLYAREKKADKAMEYFQRSANLLNQGKNYSLLSNNDIQIAKLLFSQKDNKKALDYFLLAKEYALKTPAQQQKRLREIYKGLSEVYEKAGDSKNALGCFRKYIVFRDSLLNTESTTRILEIEKKYENEKNQQLILRMEVEKREKEQLLDVRKKWMLFWFCGCALLVLGSTLIWFQNRRLGFANRLLVRKNVDMVEAEEKLKFLSDQPVAAEAPAENLISKTEKYAGSVMSIEQKEDLLRQIRYVLEQEKAFCQKDLTVNKLAEQLHTNKSYISQVFNEKLGRNFNAIINEYRIKEAVSLLSDLKKHHLTIEAIATDSGFNSISAFNSAFKKYTGVTPSFFLKAVKEQALGDKHSDEAEV
jgi:AraC-like DNA-binding protein